MSNVEAYKRRVNELREIYGSNEKVLIFKILEDKKLIEISSLMTEKDSKEYSGSEEEKFIHGLIDKYDLYDF